MFGQEKIGSKIYPNQFISVKYHTISIEHPVNNMAMLCPSHTAILNLPAYTMYILSTC